MIDTRSKIVASEGIGEAAVVAVGRFDVIRAEHCRILRGARRGAGPLVAAVLPDAAEETSLFDQQSRAQLTAALADVDEVVICDRAEAAELADRLFACGQSPLA